jgi:hypothetical protein
VRLARRALARTAEAAGHPRDREDAAGWLPLAKWLHMLGFRGHFASKSRRYSTTLGRLRAARFLHRRAAERTTGAGPREVGDDHDPADDDTTLVVGTWRFAGMGWLNTADAALAASAAARARERRDAAWDAAA